MLTSPGLREPHMREPYKGELISPDFALTSLGCVCPAISLS